MSPTSPPIRKQVAIVGAGFIANAHLQCLSRLDVDVTAVCDPNDAAAAALQQRWSIPQRYSDLDTLLAGHRPDIVHVLTPPPTHADLAERCLRAGVSVFLEKPMALSTAEADRLIELSNGPDQAVLGVNHNALFFPAFRRLRADVRAGRIGRIEHLSLVVNAPMRQLETNQHGHWAFQHPGNLAFESIYHPLTQIHDLIGATVDLKVTTTGARELAPGRVIFDTWSIDLVCQRGTAQLFFSCAKPFPTYAVSVLGQEATAQLDVLNNGYRLQGRTRHLWFLDSAIGHVGSAGASIAAAARNVAGFTLSTLKLIQPNDPFTSSIDSSIAAFHSACATGERPPVDGIAGKVVVETCQQLSTIAASDPRVAQGASLRPGPRSTVTNPDSDPGNILVIGANGFIGQHLTTQLINHGHNVRVLLHSPERLPDALQDDRVQIYRGDIMDLDSLLRAMEGARFVYHLAGAAKDSWAATSTLIVDGTMNVAEACRTSGVQRLIYTSTIAAYYLGGRRPITETSSLDPGEKGRNHYARAKILSERALRDFERQHGLEVVICRPGVVIGPGGLPRHSAIGTWPNPSHVVGWGSGMLPVPLVLVQDCAEALARLVEIDQLDLTSFNLVGETAITPREYVRALEAATGRRIQYHRMPISVTYATDLVKWVIKVLTRRPGTVFPSWRDLATRSQRAPFDVSATKRILRWQPERDPERVIARGIGYLRSDPDQADQLSLQRMHSVAK